MKVKKIIISMVAVVGLTSTLSASSDNAEALFDAKCGICHSKTMPTQAQMNSMVAPALFGVMNHLKMAYPNKEDAVKFMVDYVQYPSKDKAICLKSKIAQFGIMPSQKGLISEDELEDVAEWMFDNFPPKGFVGRGMQNRPSFAMFDLNDDGVVTKDELTKFRAKRKAKMAAAGMPMRNAANSPAFESMDLNGDQELTQQEFNQFRMNRMGTMQNQRGMNRGTGMTQRGMKNRPSFQDFDLNGDGMISQQEFNQFRMQRMQSRMGTMQNQRGGMMNNGTAQRGMQNRPNFAMFDLNGDGVVTKDELTKFRADRKAKMAAQGMPMRNAAYSPAFESMDLNGDQELTQQEFNQFRMNRYNTK